MGLGKTLQMLCLIAATKAPTPDLSKTHATSTLIITETSVLNSWKDDFFKHFSVNGPTDPDVPTTKSKGKTKQTEPLSTSSSTLTPNSLLIWHDRKRTKDPAEIAKHTIVITTYGTALSDLATLERVSWCRIVLDEAQKIKNGSSKKSNKTFQAVIRLQAYRRWCLTGTPMENSTSDIVSLMMFLRVNPQTISDFTTAADRNPPIKAAQILRSLMLLRTKAELSKNGLGMPTCHRLKLYLEMTEKELEILEKYKMGDGKNALANLMFERRAVNGLLPRSKDGASSKYSSGWDDEEEDGEATDGMAVGTVQPKSFSKEDINYFEGTKLDAVFKLIRSILNSDPQFLMDLNFTLESPTEQSSKVTASVADPQLKGSKLTQPTKHPSLSAALQLLTSPPTFRIRPNSHDSHEPSTSSQAPRTNPPNASSPPKVVIFSQWTTMLDLIGAYLEESKVPFQRLDGQMSPAKRKEALEKFAETDASKNSKRSGIQPQILLLSLKAGGVGLNIHANVAVLIDPWYNPMVEKQAFDRIYRLSSPYTDIIFVRIYAMNSIEARVKEIGDSKTETWERLKDLMLRQ
ncbi:hypothetical protein HK102_002705 [Quaeritorhiza haematococci]|nr:hypothetical protein HK102_002705 [Quaeritorhiza haematococci]